MQVLNTDEVHVFYADLNHYQTQFEYHQSLLSADELERAERFYFEKDTISFTHAHGLLRRVLSQYQADVAPEDWLFEIGEKGKPYLTAAQNPNGLVFNISHSGSYLAIAISTLSSSSAKAEDPDSMSSCMLGVDIELIKPKKDLLDIAKRFFAEAEYQALSTLPEDLQTNRFYQIWTAKEAFIKALGLGLSFPLSDFVIDFAESSKPQQAKITHIKHPDFSKYAWQLSYFDGVPDCMLAVVCEQQFKAVFKQTNAII